VIRNTNLLVTSLTILTEKSVFMDTVTLPLSTTVKKTVPLSHFERNVPSRSTSPCWQIVTTTDLHFKKYRINCYLRLTSPSAGTGK
jgi:hypothetical protein